ncbi:alpha/beta hydrolase [Aphanothece sacrum]|uniref:Alpha/beta hydrolase n=1 Tax=Aphanothece sacrum FPU1 TaxID=1920663 RepID=A0A401IBT2_APHSA|nr:alpha/beta hydrolase [Aphanothece sacrum]GBF78738.1 alpha/beta hydrolase [Aphanothece sacrum FPU1]GBF82970.1 alpha/beta hydrolase [Aphanothece sacrum FPU3]
MIINLLLKAIISGAGITIITYFAACFALLLWQHRLIFVPSRKVNTTPQDLGLTYEDVWLSVSSFQRQGERLHGWWIPNNLKGDRVLLYLHGNGGNISYNLGPAQRFNKLGFSVFMIDYCGYGRSGGEFPTEAEVYRDAQLAWNYLVEERQIQPKNIFIYGHSLGGAIAIDLGVRQPHAAGIIVENTFTSIREMVDERGLMYRLFPIELILQQRFDSLSKLRLLQVPLLLIHGISDSTVPAKMSQRLFNAANVPKKLLLVPDAGHNNVGAVSEEKYDQTVSEFSELVRHTQAKSMIDIRFESYY